MSPLRQIAALLSIGAIHATGASFSIMSRLNGKCLDAEDGLFPDGLQLTVRTCNERLNQLWDFNVTSSADFPVLGKGLVQLAAAPSKCLTAPQLDGSPVAELCECGSCPYQEWGYNGQFQDLRVSNSTKAKCLDVQQGAWADGTPVVVYTCLGPNQKWSFPAPGLTANSQFRPTCAGDREDWLYRSSTLECGCGEWDNNPWTIGSRIFLPILYAFGAVLVFLACRSGAYADEESDSEDAELLSKPKKKERNWAIDFARIVCIACTITEHSGGEAYSEKNILWAQQWVLPYLYLISGVSFMFSSGPLWAYILKLCVVLVVGTCCNWVGDAISGRDWRGDFGNTVFQMAYVMVLMLMAVLFAPLRSTLRWRTTNGRSAASLGSDGALSMIVCGVIFCLCFTFFVMGWPFVDLDQPPDWMEEASGSGLRGLFYQGPFLLSQIFFMAILGFIACRTGSSGWVPWVGLAIVYLPRIVIPYSRGGHPLNADIYALGMLAHSMPLQGASMIAKGVREYWPIWIAVLMVMSMPEVKGRCDLYPHNTMWERFRFYFIECFLVVALLSGAFNTSDSWGCTGWLTKWALFAYCTHVFFARVLPVPFGAIVSYSTALIFFVLDLQSRRRIHERDSSDESGDD